MLHRIFDCWTYRPKTSINSSVLTFWSSTGHVHPLRTASITLGFKMPTWCAFVGRLSPLQPPVSRNSWPTSSAGERRGPPSTRFSCGPTRARHKTPPTPLAPLCQMCQPHPPHLSPSKYSLPNTSWWDCTWEDPQSETRLCATGWGCSFRSERLTCSEERKTNETSSGCNLQIHDFFFFFGS